MRRVRGPGLAAVLVAAAVAYALVAWWFVDRSAPVSVGTGGVALLSLAVAAQLGGKWMFGELFRDGVLRQGVQLGRRPAFRAALVGAGVSRLLPVGGAVTPVAMAWTVRRQAQGTTGAAVRATTLNYSALMIVTGAALIWVEARSLVPVARSGLTVAGLVTLVVGSALMAGSGRLATLSRLLPERLGRRLAGVLLDHTPDLRSQVLLWSRVLLEAGALVLVLRAFGIDATAAQMLAAFGVSHLFAGLPGTPGGLGYAEAGLIGALGVFGFPPELTVGPTLVYRGVSYWLPAGLSLLAGGLSFVSSPNRLDSLAP